MALTGLASVATERLDGCGIVMKKSGRIARNAVTMSIASTRCSGMTPRRSAPRGGATMFMSPWRPWFSPLMRARCSSGTSSEVDACMAGK